MNPPSPPTTEWKPPYIDCFNYENDEKALLAEAELADMLSLDPSAAGPSVKRYEDRAFTGMSSVYLDYTRPPRGALPADLIKWCRISAGEVQGMDAPQLFPQKQQPFLCNVVQGQLGDRWFLSALGALAQARCMEKLERLFVSKRYASVGLYTVKFWKDGTWRYIHIDDVLPCDVSSRPLFARGANGNALWIPLLEKAYAKLHGSYEVLGRAGRFEEALCDLLGPDAVPHFSRAQISNPSEEWSRVQELSDARDLVAMERTPSLSTQGLLPMDPRRTLMSGRAYILMRALELKDPESKQIFRLVLLRNPWGLRPWNGDWSLGSKTWTDFPRIKRMVEQMAADDYRWNDDEGTFWIAWEDLSKQADVIRAVRVVPSDLRLKQLKAEWTSSSTSLGDNPQFCFAVPAGGGKSGDDDEKSDMNVYITMHCRDRRWTGISVPSPANAKLPFGIALCTLSEGHRRLHRFRTPKLIAASHTVARQQGICCSLPRGGRFAIIAAAGDAQAGQFFIDVQSIEKLAWDAEAMTVEEGDSDGEQESGDGNDDDGSEEKPSKDEEQGNEEGIAFTDKVKVEDSPVEEDLEELTQLAMQRTMCELGIAVNDLRMEVHQLEARIAKSEGKI
eukprot:g725.t1